MKIKELAKQGLSFNEMLELQNDGHQIEIEEEISSDNFLSFVVTLQHELIKAKTTKGLEKARAEGRVGGRPKVSDEVINKIKYLHKTQKYTLRQIAEELEISLGTASKYAKED